MTREEAIKELKILKEDYWDDDGYGHETKQYDDTMLALDMAIKALDQEPCEDAISRKDTLKAMIEQLGIRNEDYLLPAEATLYKVVKNMPLVTPEPKMGHWIEERTYMECPNCHDIWHYEKNQVERFKCCPTCGERLK